MKSEENETKNNDNSSIIIKDYNASFLWLYIKYTGIPLMIIVLIIYPLIMGTEIKAYTLSTVIILYPIIMLYIKSDDRKIVLSKNSISYDSLEEKLSEIDLSQPSKFFLSYQNYYHKNQDLDPLYFVFVYFFVSLLMKSFIDSTLLILGAFIVTFMMQQITKYIVSDMGFRFFTFVLVQQGDNVVSIPIFKKQDYLNVQEYLLNRGLTLEHLPKFFKAFYGIERNL